jgi:hypothetical protein
LPRARSITALAAIAFTWALLAPSPARAGLFAQSWSVTDWRWAFDIGSSDADSQDEVLFESKIDGHYAIFDLVTGKIEKQFPGLSSANTSFDATDMDGDGRTDLILYSNLDVHPQFFKVYHWTPSGYVPFISHTDSVFTFSLEYFRTVDKAEIWETSDVADDPSAPACDFRLRDSTGTLLFRASTQVPGWAPPFRAVSWLDRNQDGVSEMLLEDQSKIRMYNQYNGSFTVNWTLTGWSTAIEIGNVDADDLPELLVKSNADGHYAIVDEQTGAIQQEFPAFQYPTSFPETQDIDNDGRMELVVRKTQVGQPPVLSIHRWNGTTLATYASVTATNANSNMALFQLRTSALFEVCEQSPTDVILYNLSGAQLFRASTNIPGWSVAPYSVQLALHDPDHNYFPDLVLYDDTRIWDIRYNGTFAQAWALTGWRFVGNIGNKDDDPESEFMLSSVADGRWAIFDGVSGTKQQEFPSFTVDNSTYAPIDTDGDGMDELFFGRIPGQTPLFTAYHWDGSTYVPLYSHTQPTGTWFPVQVRDDFQYEIMEIDNNDIRVRDMTPAVIFRASTDLPSWAGLPSPFATPLSFPEEFGVRPMLVLDDARARIVLYHNTTDAPATQGMPALRVFQNAPNPFRTETAFRISNPKEGAVGIRIFDASGRLVRRLDRSLPVGTHEIRWDGRDDRGGNAPSGVLFYQVTAGGVRETRKFIRLQ